MDKKREKLKITEWAIEDRPREKMMLHGIRALSNAELIAILIVRAMSMKQRLNSPNVYSIRLETA